MYFAIPIFVQFLMNVRVTSVKMGQDVSGELVIISVTVCHITRVHFVRTKVTIASYSTCMHLRTGNVSTRLQHLWSVRMPTFVNMEEPVFK